MNGERGLSLIGQREGVVQSGLGFTIINFSKLLCVRIHSNSRVHLNMGIKKLVEKKGFLEFWSTCKTVSTILPTTIDKC